MKVYPIRLITFLLFCIFTLPAIAQESEEEWYMYMATYENNMPGSTVLRIDLADQAPFKEYPVVLVTGLSYISSNESGLPHPDSYDAIYKEEDKLVTFIQDSVPCIFTGTFMYNNERLAYFYIQSEEGVEELIENFYSTHFPEQEYYIGIENDAEWTYYLDFLYPTPEIMNYMGDQSVVNQLMDAGDDLTKARRVDHWIYFSEKNELKAFKSAVKEEGYETKKVNKFKGEEKPYQLIIYREDKVDLESINAITEELRKLAASHNGDYDGWETFVIKN